MHEGIEMARAQGIDTADRFTPVWRRFGALLSLAVAGVLTACSGGAEQAMEGGSGGVVIGSCATGANSATLTWETVSNPDLAGYRVYYGTAPMTYSTVVPVAPNVTTHTVTGLNSATTYYFAATAYDTSNNESVFSNEVCKTVS